MILHSAPSTRAGGAAEHHPLASPRPRFRKTYLVAPASLALTSAALLETLQHRYATKAFDPTRQIDPETWSALEQALVLTPSSYGLQPWKFLVISNPELRAALRPYS